MAETFSKYTHLIATGGKYFLYNLTSGRVCALDNRMFDTLADNFNDPGKIETLNPEMHAALKQGGFIADVSGDETERLIKRFEEQESDPALFEIIVNPTLDCNLRCWYCYEEHLKGTDMRAPVLDSIKRLIERKTSDPALRHLAVTFFGGEPLLRYKSVVKPLLTYAVGLCRQKNIGFNTGFTTNGFLLTHKMFEELSELGLAGTSFQISFDGNRETHDKSRVYDPLHPTFDRMLEAVRAGAEMGFRMCARFNYTPDNLDSFNDVVDIMSGWDEQIRKNITVNFQQVWQTSDGISNDTKGHASAMQKRIRELGMTADCDMVYHRHVCYADRANNIVVNYNGDVYKCTARKFDREKREGVLSPDGEIIYQNSYNRRMSIKFANKACRECVIMPICNGRCSQNKLEKSDTEKCFLDMDNKQRERYLLGSIIQKITKESLSDSELAEITIDRHLSIFNI